MRTSIPWWWSWTRRRSLWWKSQHCSRCSHWSSGWPTLPSTSSHYYHRHNTVGVPTLGRRCCTIPASWRLFVNCWSSRGSGVWSATSVCQHSCRPSVAMMFYLNYSDWSHASGWCPATASLPLTTLKSRLSMSATPCQHRSLFFSNGITNVLVGYK